MMILDNAFAIQPSSTSPAWELIARCQGANRYTLPLSRQASGNNGVLFMKLNGEQARDAATAADESGRCRRKGRRGPKKSPMIQMTSRPGMGGLWGREGVHPGIEVLLGNLRLSPNDVLTVQEYRLITLKSQANTLRN